MKNILASLVFAFIGFLLLRLWNSVDHQIKYALPFLMLPLFGVLFVIGPIYHLYLYFQDKEDKK
jgi:hypothetical protein